MATPPHNMGNLERQEPANAARLPDERHANFSDKAGIAATRPLTIFRAECLLINQELPTGPRRIPLQAVTTP